MFRSANTLTRSSYPAWTQRLLEEAQQLGLQQLPQLQCFLADACSNLAVIHSLKITLTHSIFFDILRDSSTPNFQCDISKFEVCLRRMYLDRSSSGVATNSSRGEGGSRLLGLCCTCWYKSASLRFCDTFALLYWGCYFAMLCHSVSKQTLFAHLREVYYQSKTDIYNKWNSEACCLSAASTFGSDGGNPNIVVFTATIGNFGFCECTAWDPSNPGTSCAGEATAENMVCPVLGAQKEMCGESTNWDGLPVGCGTVSSTASPSTTTTTTTTSTEGCCYWDAETGCPGNDYCDQSKSNCEASCNGKWKSIFETTVSSTASVTTTPATTAKTTAATTATITTLPTTSTTETDMFEPVDGGVDRVCRGSTPTDNALEYFTVASHLVVRSSV